MKSYSRPQTILIIGIEKCSGKKIPREKSHVSSSLTDSIANLLVGVEWFRVPEMVDPKA